MTFEEYDKKIGELGDKLRADYSEELYEKVSDFQMEHMMKFLAQYQDSVGDDPAKDVCCDLLSYAVCSSQSGSAIVYVDTEELADKVDDIIMDEIGRYLLDPPEIYKDGDQWAIDCMFGGSYVPYWDGWKD